MGYKAVTLQSVLANTKNFDNPIGTAKEFGLSYILECFVCEMGEIAVRGAWPDGWQELKDYDYVLCPECAEKLKERVRSERIKTANNDS